MTKTAYGVYRLARSIDADAYHFHDPELIPVALLLGRGGKRVIYDSHEHLPQQILTKPWIAAPLRRPLARFAEIGERLAARLVSAVVTAEPYVRRRFTGAAARTVTVNNFPMLDEFPATNLDWEARDLAVCYAGAITELRGAREMVEAIARTDSRLLLAGRFDPPSLARDLSNDAGWSQVDFMGHLSREDLARTLARARAGLVVLHPIPNYVEANPTKMFEYMSAGIPVIASNFPAWRSIVDRHECGICVDPGSPEEIAAAIRWILANPGEAQRMGENGRLAVERLYNWGAERRMLLGLYEELVGLPAGR
jgi:glycosyltransferase involved in cell wall biosynthesis